MSGTSFQTNCPRGSGGGKGNKLPRLENGRELWGSEVEAAFIEALHVYPPMGYRRVKCYQLPSGEPYFQNPGTENLPTKSFGHHQLIQAYIRRKTGQNRTTKQISSHLQRFRHLNPTNPLASLPSQGNSVSCPGTPSESPQVNDHDIAFPAAINSKMLSGSTPSFSPMDRQHSLTSPNELKLGPKQMNGLYSTTFIVPYLVHTPNQSVLFDKVTDKNRPNESNHGKKEDSSSRMDNCQLARESQRR